jgi:hypothetical protein
MAAPAPSPPALKLGTSGPITRAMKALVISSSEPEHLASCLDALSLWLPASDVIVANNANQPAPAAQIDATARAHGVHVLRDHDTHDGSNTMPLIHEAIRSVCRAYPDQTIVKLDEDVLLVSSPARLAPAPGKFLVPNVTINNYTTKIYLDAFWPELAEACRAHDWLWHHVDPRTGRDYRVTLLELIYNTDPARLIAFCEANTTVEEIGAAEWQEKALMVAPDGYRGISSMAIVFAAADYLRLFGAASGIEEVLIGTAIAAGRASYVVDHGIYCHHMHYFTVRELLRANADYVEAYKTRILECYRARARGEVLEPIAIAGAVPAAA